uniref:Uncharacterized protein n=1 Tax=Triticum urartu TaxID=4572 RepID=A0A8R7U7V7_TRIUA
MEAAATERSSGLPSSPSLSPLIHREKPRSGGEGQRLRRDERRTREAALPIYLNGLGARPRRLGGDGQAGHGRRRERGQARLGLPLPFSVAITTTAVLTHAIEDGVDRQRPYFFWPCFPDGEVLTFG